MKIFNIFIKILTIAILILNFTNLFAQEIAIGKKYVFYNNFDPLFAQNAYYKHLSAMEEFKDYFVSMAFNDNNLTTYPITNFEVAIFPMGDKKLSDGTSKSSVISKIKEMIAAGKKVIITGRNLLQGNTTEVSNFLSNDLGIQYITRLRTQDGVGKFLGYIAFGWKYDPVGAASVKFCNQGYEGPVTQWPLAYYSSIDVFRSKDRNKYFAVDKYHQLIQDTYGSDTDSLLGIRTEIGDARIILWSIGFENFAVDEARRDMLYRAMVWVLENVPKPGSQIEMVRDVCDFGPVKVGESKQLDAEFKSVGELPLTVNEVSIAMSKDNFKIVKGEIKPENPITLNFGESHTFTVEFTPSETGVDYFGQAIIKSNSTTMNEAYVSLTGIGGNVSGPKLAMNILENTINFGKIQFQSKTFDLSLKNTGNQDLDVNVLKIIENTDDAFGFHQVIETPFTIKPGTEKIIKIRFALREEEKKYYGKIHIETNAINARNFDINLIGEVSFTLGPIISASETIVNLDTTQIGTTKTKTITVENKGDAALLITNTQITADEEDVFDLPEPFTDSINPDESATLKIAFTPKEAKTYTANIVINSNASNLPTFTIQMYGEGVSNTSVNETELHLSKHIINLIQNNFSSEAILSIINKDNTVSEMNADILDLLGRKVKNICKNLTLYPNLNNINISFQELTVGTYFIAININEYRVIIPFLIY